MCLITSQDKPYVAKYEIKCYKVIVRNWFGVYNTPIIGFRLKCSHVNGTEPVVAEGEETRLGNEIKGGYIHCFENMDNKNIGWLYLKYRFNPFRKAELHECIIPTGTEYYSDGSGSIAAKQVFIGKRVKSKYD